MKHLIILCGIALSLTAGSAMAADAVIDDFQSYTDLDTLKTKWSISSSRNDTIELGTDGGSAGTNYLIIKDEGFGLTATGTDLAVPAAGSYKFAFDYKNGQTLLPLRDLKVKLLQDNGLKKEVVIPFVAQTAWTHVETETLALSGNPVSVQITASSAAGTANQINLDGAFDEFKLVEVLAAPPAVTVFPNHEIYLSQTKTIVATPSLGSGTYTKVDFDVNNDGSVEWSDTSAPFTFDWATIQDVAVGTSRTVTTDSSNTPLPVKITLTDSTNQTASVVENYTVDNRFNGRESIVTNGDFSQWQPQKPGVPEGNPPITLPVGWVDQWTTSTAPEIGPTPGRDAGAGDALRIKFSNPTSADEIYNTLNHPDRYAIRTIGMKGNYHDLQTYYYGKGAFARLYYMISKDGGITYETTLQDAGIADGASWSLAVEHTVQNGLGLTDATWVALGTHQLGITEHFWDDLVSEGIKYPETSEVGEWKLY